MPKPNVTPPSTPIPTSNLSVCWIDNGLFCDFALSCAQSFKHTSYWSPWSSSFPSSNSLLPGDGFDEMERVRWLFDALEKTDLVIVPDVYHGDLARFLAERGMPVFGARKGELLELNRWKTKQLLHDLDLPVLHAVLLHGTDALRSYLKDHPNVWVKISTVRGDMETFQSISYDLIEPRLDELEYRLGAKKSIAEFIVEDSLDDAIEIGWDGWTIDGQFPVRSFSGIEIKDLGFIGKVQEYDALPPFMRQSNDALRDFFAKTQYRGWYSSELRVTPDKTAYLTDPCTRCPSPPNEIEQEIFSNWPEIIAQGARGHMAEPQTVHPYGVCAMLHSAWATKNWLPIRIPDAIRQFVKLRNHCRIDGVDYFVPQPGSELPEIGAVIGLGDTRENAINHLLDNADQIKAYSLDIKLDSIDTGLEEVEKAQTLGIDL